MKTERCLQIVQYVKQEHSFFSVFFLSACFKNCITITVQFPLSLLFCTAQKGSPAFSVVELDDNGGIFLRWTWHHPSYKVKFSGSTRSKHYIITVRWLSTSTSLIICRNQAGYVKVVKLMTTVTEEAKHLVQNKGEIGLFWRR